MEIFYRYDIDLEDNDDLDFGDLLEKVLELVKRKKYWVDFIRDKETEVNKYDPREKVPTAPNIESFIYPVQDFVPHTRFHTVQWGVQEDMPAIWVHTSRIRKFGAGEPRDEKVEQLYVDSAIVAESVDNTISFGRYTQRPDTSSKSTSRKFLNPFEAGIRAKKKSGIIPKERFAGFDSMIVGRGEIKSKDHGWVGATWDQL